MMSVLQNAFANSSSSLIQSKITGNIVFVLLPPISYLEFFWRLRAAASVVRGLVVGGGVLAGHGLVRRPAPGGAALDAGVRACSARRCRRARPDRRHRLGEVRPARGVPELRHPAAHLARRACSTRSIRCRPSGASCRTLNPFFYMIDGFRYGFFGVADVSPWRQPRAGRGELFRRIGGCCVPYAAQIGLQTENLTMVTPESVKSGHRGRPRLRAPRSDRRRPALPGGGRLGAVRRQEPRAAPPAGLRGARRPHARGDPRAVDADADARGMERRRESAHGQAEHHRRPAAARRGPASPARRTPRCRSCAPRCSRRQPLRADQRAAPDGRLHHGQAARADGRGRSSAPDDERRCCTRRRSAIRPRPTSW